MRNLVLLFSLFFQLASFATERVSIDAVLDLKIERFEVSGSLDKVLEKLREQSYDQVSKSRRLNIVYISSIKELDGFARLELDLAFENLPSAQKLVSASKEFSFNIKQKTFREILIQVCSKWNLRYIIDSDAVIISQPTFESEKEYPKFYSLNDYDLDKIETSNIKGFLKSHDIRYEKDQLVKYLKALNSFALVLTGHNHEKLKLVLSKYSLKAKFDKLNNTIKNNVLHKEGLDEFKKEFSSLYKQSYRKELIKEKSLAESLFQLVVPKVKVENYSLAQLAELIQEISKSLSENGQPIKIVVSEGLHQGITEKISLNLEQVPLKKLIEYSCQQFGITYQVDGDNVYFSETEMLDLATSLYPISAQLLEFLNRKGVGPDCRATLERLGIELGLGSWIKFPKTQMALVITASEENHKKIKEVFDFLNSVKSRDPFDR